MFNLHDDKGADLTLGPVGLDADGNPAVPPTGLKVAVLETPPLVTAVLSADGKTIAIDAIPGLPLGVATVRLTGDNGFQQDFGVTIVAEGASNFPGATLGAERPSTAKAAVTPLAALYPDAASFTAAVAAYKGPEEVDLDGATVRPGTAPALTYFTHSDAGGTIDTTGPTS